MNYTSLHGGGNHNRANSAQFQLKLALISYMTLNHHVEATMHE